MVSDSTQVKLAVPQGTALRPRVFNLWVNDISNRIGENTLTKYFANDCFLYLTNSESKIPLDRLQEKIVKLENYFSPFQKDSEAEFLFFFVKN